VQKLANRATLVALNALTAGRRDDASGDLAESMKDLVRDVREATDRTAQLTNDIENAVADAGTRMRDARERAVARLGEPAPAPAPAAPGARAFDDAQRLLERVREMVQDAARKGERLSAAGERASRAAERLARRVGEESAEAQALVIRMSPGGTGEAPPAPVAHELHLLGERPDAPGAAAASGRRREDLP